ncbi:MAG: ABC transporter substrate-binding protein [Actinobacteria bacterium]|nr:ABC transporter substrate-binding protein [Actinomycetota bacterium]
MRSNGHWRAMVGAAAAGSALMAVGVVGLPGVASATVGRLEAGSGSIVSFAEQAGAAPNYIFPETTSANQSLYNDSQFINLMYPLVYLPNPYQPTMDYSRSMAYPPVFSDHDTVATVKLKHWMWSDGSPVTARDLVFYINLGKAEGATWGNYAGPSQFPYNLKSYTALNATTIRFVLKSPMNPTYFIDNGIDYISPLPQQAWDKTSPNGPVGNYDMTPAGAKKVLAFLQKEASDTRTYATNPLWKVVDGPYMLKSFGGASAPDVFVANPHYSGTAPAIKTFEEVPFTSSSAEFTALESGTVDYGYVPTQDIPAMARIKAEGYSITPSPTWGFDYIIPNQKNPKVGPILSQAYMRQVLAHLVDQNTMIAHFMQGYGIPTYGPTPIYPKGNPFLSPAESHNPYPYSVKDAEKILKAHGWQVNPGKVDVCQVPGPKGCGAGVTKGEKLSLNLLYSSGLTIMQEDTDLFQSDASLAGVQINPKAETFNTVISQVQPCTPKGLGTPTCNWQLGEYGGISLSTYPSGEGLLNTGGAFNAGQFSDPTLDKLIQDSTTSTSLAVYKSYEDAVVKLEPWIWQPVPDNIFATKKGLSGYGLTSEFDGGFGYIEPEFWTFK